MQTEVAIDRLAMRARPEGSPIMHQRWEDLLFLHWPVSLELLRPLIPAPLEIDTFEGQAWIGTTPFELTDLHITSMPPITGLSSFHECNVRTYVHYDGVPGVWFFSLDCNSPAAVMAARTFYHLPYYNADIELEQRGDTIAYLLNRTEEAPALFQGSWNIGETVPFSHPESLEFFLTERYCLYSERGGELYRARIFHQPWPLQKATMNNYQSTMIEALGVKTFAGEPVLQYAEEIDVEIWGIKRV